MPTIVPFYVLIYFILGVAVILAIDIINDKALWISIKSGEDRKTAALFLVLWPMVLVLYIYWSIRLKKER